MTNNNIDNIDDFSFNDSEVFFLETLITSEWGYREGTVKTYKFNIRHFIDYIKKKEKQLVKETTKEDITSYFQYLRRTNLAYNTIYNRYSTLKLFFVFLYDYGLIKKNPMASYKLVQRSRARRRERERQKRKTFPLSKEQMKTLLAFIRDYKYSYSAVYLKVHRKKILEQEKKMITINGKKWKPIYLRDYLITALLYSTGMRKVELLSIRKKQLDLEGHLFKEVERKGGIIQDIIITDLIKKYVYTEEEQSSDTYTSMLDLLKIYIESMGENEKIFPINISLVNKRMKLYGSKIANFPHLFPHKLRHTFGSHFASLGANLTHIKLMMAHEHITTTEIYVKPKFESVIEAWRKMGLYTGKATPDLIKKEIKEVSEQ